MKINESNLKFRYPFRTRKNTSYIIIHHAEATECTIQDIHQWHLNKKWSGCGYHYFIRKDGSIHRGRPLNKIGAHCKGNNSCSVGICLEGNFMKYEMSEVQKQSLINLCSHLITLYPGAEIKGHRELYSTDCPGIIFPLTEIKEKIGQGENLDILELQKFLNTHGFRDDRNKVLVEDGIVGTRTREAFKKLKEVEL